MRKTDWKMSLQTLRVCLRGACSVIGLAEHVRWPLRQTHGGVANSLQHSYSIGGGGVKVATANLKVRTGKDNTRQGLYKGYIRHDIGALGRLKASWVDGRRVAVTPRPGMYVCVCMYVCMYVCRGVPRIFGEGGGERRGGGGGPRSAKEANKPNKRATGLKPRTCAHQGSMFRP